MNNQVVSFIILVASLGALISIIPELFNQQAFTDELKTIYPDIENSNPGFQFTAALIEDQNNEEAFLTLFEIFITTLNNLAGGSQSGGSSNSSRSRSINSRSNSSNSRSNSSNSRRSRKVSSHSLSPNEKVLLERATKNVNKNVKNKTKITNDILIQYKKFVITVLTNNKTKFTKSKSRSRLDAILKGTYSINPKLVSEAKNVITTKMESTVSGSRKPKPKSKSKSKPKSKSKSNRRK